jgi:threonine/homoserine/homoserine lactone efflux protein
MTWSSWWLFVASTLFISATPGPNMLLAFQYGLNYGTRKTLYTLAGLSCGLLILLCLSIAGVSLVSTQMPVVFQALKAVGAVYLLYLGWQAWQAQGAALEGPLVRVQPSRVRLFKVGLAVSLSNPKAILFFAAFFPQFVNHNQPQLPQYLILMASFFMFYPAAAWRNG